MVVRNAKVLVPMSFCMAGCSAVYVAMDEAYQEAMDPVRVQATEDIQKVMLAYHHKKGKFPFGELAAEQPVMTIIARSEAEEIEFAKIEVLNKGALLVTAKALETELSKELGFDVVLPRDPQKVTTFAPNVYVYFITPEQDLCIVSHLYFPTPETVEYSWEGGRFNSYANCIPMGE